MSAEKNHPPTIGFGVPTTPAPHHFRVLIPRGNRQPVLISEDLGVAAPSLAGAVIDRVRLERPRWSAIANEVKRAFNQRLRQEHLATGQWKVGENPVDRLLGKELCVLAWAIEDAAPEKIGLALRNWLALRPEERWWLFGMTAMAAGGLNDSGKGWRMALRYALADTAQAVITPARGRSDKRAGEDPAQVNLPLFD